MSSGNLVQVDRLAIEKDAGFPYLQYPFVSLSVPVMAAVPTKVMI
jgi:hypothetical protein